MINRINVDTVLKSLGQGMTEPALILADDFNKYVLKTDKVYIEGKFHRLNCMFLNEMLAYQIARDLAVPVPEAAVAYLDKRILDRDSKATFSYRFYEGNLFASSAIDNLENNLVENYNEMAQMGKPYITRTWNNFFTRVTNPEDIAKIIALDLLIANFDRYRNEGNLLISNTESGRKVYAIDHGHAFFGPVWHIDKVNALKSVNHTQDYRNMFINTAFQPNIKQGLMNGLGTVFKALEEKVDLTNVDNHSFIDVVELIEGITEEQIEEWFSEIPDEWFCDRVSQIAYYKQFLLLQKNEVRHIIQTLAYRSAFTNYLGGELNWKEERDAGIV